MKVILNLLFFISILLFAVACEKEQEDPNILPPHEMDVVEKRINELALKKRQDCLDKALNLATARVDSTLLQMDVLIPIDVEGTIIRPLRPMTPIKRQKTDTTAIRPFIPTARDSQ
ncbi:MAG: hypothetical protein EA362_05120 [Saprospirales bacterium]|nr:MAG: hypothetical protein EA362_05120 [Saprospirales bacterium]